MTPLLEIAGLGVTLPGETGRITALRGVDLVLEPGERLALVGESGSGKTTLLLAIAGLLPAEAEASGVVRFPALGRRARPGADLGFVFQDPFTSLDPVMAVGEQIAEVLVVHHGARWAAARRAATVLLERVGIPDPERRRCDPPHRFSGGQRQRIAIAVAMAAGPRLLLADEPTSALDTVVRAQILDLLDGLVREQGAALLLVTHDLALARRIADRIAVLFAGRLVECGPAERLVEAPRHPYTRALLATARALERGELPEEAEREPAPAAEGAGCPYAPRCPLAFARCRTDPPPRPGARRDAVACHLEAE